MNAAIARAYGALWVATATGAVLALAGMPIVQAGRPHDALTASATTAASLLAHNLPVALWPLALAALGWTRLAMTRKTGDVLSSGQLLLHGLMVGNALGQQPALWRYLPHLPFEWLGIAIPLAGWQLARNGQDEMRQTAYLTVVTVAAMLIAACVETWAVPL